MGSARDEAPDLVLPQSAGRVVTALQSYHVSWLTAHPGRGEEWLRRMLREGFDVHHLDGNHSNDAPDNLVLIEHTDHMMIHAGRTLGRLTGKLTGRPPRKRRRTILPRRVGLPPADWVPPVTSDRRSGKTRSPAYAAALQRQMSNKEAWQDSIRKRLATATENRRKKAARETPDE